MFPLQFLTVGIHITLKIYASIIYQSKQKRTLAKICFVSKKVENKIIYIGSNSKRLAQI